MLVNRFVIRRDGVRERRGIPLVQRNALRRLFIRSVERTALRNADVFLAAANPNNQPPPSINKVSFITTPRLNQFAMYVGRNAPLADMLAAQEYFTHWLLFLRSRGYDTGASNPAWRLIGREYEDANGVIFIASAGTQPIFAYGGGQTGEQ
jgi:hypothetical protein